MATQKKLRISVLTCVQSSNWTMGGLTDMENNGQKVSLFCPNCQNNIYDCICEWCTHHLKS